MNRIENLLNNSNKINKTLWIFNLIKQNIKNIKL
jgi:hypothetical protein